MCSVFCPEGGLPRLTRFVERGVLPHVDLVSIFDDTKNLLIVSRPNFELLSEGDQRDVLRTQQPNVMLRRVPNRLPQVVYGS